MPVHLSPRYELTLYKPKVEDPTESAILTQLEDAGQLFVVTTDPSDAHPYLAIPEGRGGQIQEPERRVEIGSSTVRVLDARMTGQLDRWVTRFVGDTVGRNRLKGIKARVREWDSAAAQWVTLYTRRVRSVRMASSKLWIDFELKDVVDDLDTDVFVGPPHASVDYVGRGSLLPAGMVELWGELSHVVLPLRGTMKAAVGGGIITIDRTAVTHGRDIIIRELYDRVWAESESSGFMGLLSAEYIRTIRVRVKIIESAANPGRVGEQGDFRLAKTIGLPSAFVLGPQIAMGFQVDDKQRWRATSVGISELPASEPAHITLPAAGDVLEFHVFGRGEATERDPIMIGPVHPARLAEDLLAGKFGPMDEAGEPGISFAASAPAFAALKADPSFGTVTLIATEPRSLRDVLEKTLNLPHGLGYRINELGQYVPLDWRVTQAQLAGLQDIGDEDLRTNKTDTLEWEDAEEGAITKISVTHYSDQPEAPWQEQALPEGIPDVTALRFTTKKHTRHVLLGRFGQLGERSLSIDAQGIRDVSSGSSDEASERVRAQLARIPDPFRSPFGNGPRYITLTLRRTATVTSCLEGDLRRLTVSAVIDPATRRRGGPRLARCVQRTPRGQDLILKFLDLGSDVVATAPVFGAVVKNAADGRHAIDAPITLNGLGEPVALEYALTSTAVGARPADNDAAWTPAARVTETGTPIISPVPAGKRVWLRARTEVDEGADPKIPSGWVYPGAGYVDTDPLPAPSGLVLAAVGRTIVATCTGGDAELAVMPIIAVSPATPVPALRLPLPPGSERHVFTDLLAATDYIVGFKHVDGRGGESLAVTAAVTTGATAQLFAPRRLQIRQGRTSLARDLAAPDEASIGYGLWVAFHPAEPLARHRLQVSTVEDFATIEEDLVVDPGVALYPMIVQRDAADAERFVRVRAERAEFAPSPWSEIISARPMELLAQPGPDMFPAGFAELRNRPSGELELRLGDGGDGDTDRAYFAVVKNPASVTAYPAVDEDSPYIDRAQMPYDGTVDDGESPMLGVAGDFFLARVRYWSAVAGFGQQVLLKLSIASDAVVDCVPVLDEDGPGNFMLHPYRTAVSKSVIFLKVVDGADPDRATVIATGDVSTEEDFLVHETQKENEPVTIGLVACEMADGTGAQGPVRYARDVYRAGQKLPTIKAYPYTPLDLSKEGVRLVGRAQGAQVKVLSRVYTEGAGAPAFDDSGLRADPWEVKIEVPRPGPSDPRQVVEFYAEDEHGNKSHEQPQRVYIDGNLIPTGWFESGRNEKGEPEISAEKDDTDTGSWRLRVVRTTIGDKDNFAEPAYSDVSDDEYSGSDFGVVQILQAWRLDHQRLNCIGYFYRTPNPSASAQVASLPKFGPVRFSIVGGDTGNRVVNATCGLRLAAGATFNGWNAPLEVTVGSEVAELLIQVGSWVEIDDSGEPPWPPGDLRAAYSYTVAIAGPGTYRADLKDALGATLLLGKGSQSIITITPKDADGNAGRPVEVTRPSTLSSETGVVGLRLELPDGGIIAADRGKLSPDFTVNMVGGRPELGVVGGIGATGATGPAGDPGTNGAPGPTGATGARGLTHRGNWSSAGVNYAVDDSVFHIATGSSYRCIAAHTSDGAKDPTNGTYWTVYAMQGDQGLQGPTGPQGPAGGAGATGATGPGGDPGGPGPAGATGATGPRGLTHRGNWSSAGVNYAVDDSVFYIATGSSYRCVAAHTSDGTKDPTNGTFWTVYAMRGDQGLQGIQGATGPQGAMGPQGPQGPQGDPGTNGGTGATGATGAQGPQGMVGNEGPQGATGPQGPAGAAGAAGPAGATGATGATGPAGDPGANGGIGATGATGPAGGLTVFLTPSNGYVVTWSSANNRAEWKAIPT